MSYKGKKPTYEKVTVKESVQLQNLSSTPSNPESNYYKLYFKNNSPFYLDENGVEQSLRPDIALNIELPVHDEVQIGEPAHIFSSGQVSFRRSKDTLGEDEILFESSNLPVSSNVPQSLKTKSFSSSYLLGGEVAIVQTEDNDLFGFERQSNTLHNLFLQSEMASIDVHPLDPEIAHTVFLRDGQIAYLATDLSFSTVQHTQDLVPVDNLQYLKVICFTPKNADSVLSDKREFAVIYVDDGVLKIASFAYVEAQFQEQQTPLVAYWENLFWGQFSGDKTINVIAASPLAEDLVDISGNPVKHVHMHHSANTENTFLVPVVDNGSSLDEHEFELTSASAAATRTVTYNGSSVSTYPYAAEEFGSFGHTEHNARYWRIGNTITTPAGSFDLSSEGSVVGMTTPVAKGGVVSAIFVDRTVEISNHEEGGVWFAHQKTFNNNLVLADGSNYLFTANFDRSSTDHSLEALKTFAMFIDEDGFLSTMRINNIENKIEPSANARVIQLKDENVAKRFIKPIAQDVFSISGEYENAVSEYNYTTDSLTQHSLTIQGQTSGITPYALPLGFDRIAIVNQDYTDPTKAYIDVRLLNGTPYAIIGSNSFTLGESFDIKNAILLSTGVWALHTGTQIKGFSWDENTLQTSNPWTLTSTDFSGDDILEIAPLRENEFVASTRNATHGVSIHHIVSGAVSTTLLVDDFNPDTSVVKLFSYKDGVVIAAQNSSDSDWKTIIVDQVFDIKFTSDEEFFPDALLAAESLNPSSLMDIRGGDAVFNLRYDNYAQVDSLVSSPLGLGTAQGMTQDSQLIPDLNSKAETELSRYVFNDGLTDGNLLVGYTEGEDDVSDIAITYPIAESSEVRYYDGISIDNDTALFSYVQPDGDILYRTVVNGVAQPVVPVVNIPGAKTIKAFNPFSSQLVFFTTTETDLVVVGAGASYTPVSGIKEIHPVMFGTSFVCFFLNSDDDLGYVSGVVDETGVVSVKNQQTILSNITNIDVQDNGLSSASILINGSVNEVRTFVIDESSVIFEDSIAVPTASYQVLNRLGYGLIIGASEITPYSIDDDLLITKYDPIAQALPTDARRCDIGESFFAFASDDTVFLFDLQKNQLFEHYTIEATRENTIRCISFSGSTLTLFTTVGLGWFTNGYDLNLTSESGTYIGVSQESVIGSDIATISVKGGFSTVHNNLTPNTTVFSSDGSVELGIALTENIILLSSLDFEKVIKPVNVTPGKSAILTQKPTSLTGTPFIDSLYSRPVSLRRFRVATDKLFQNIVYEGVEDPYNASHTLTDTDWIQENETYYWECQDENDLGFTSEWSIPTTWAVSLVAEVNQPSILSPSDGSTDVVLEPTLTSSTFVADPTQTHLDTSWQVFDFNDNLIWESLNDSVNLLSIAVPPNILFFSGAFKARCRHNSSLAGQSAWSEFSSFYTVEIAGFLTVAHSNPPYTTMYSQNVDSFEKIADLDEYPAGNGNDISLSSDGIFMAVAHETDPGLPTPEYMTIYQRNGRDFVKNTLVDTPIPGEGIRLDFSPVSDYLSVVHDASPWITNYKRAGGFFNKLADPADLPVGRCTGVRWSLDESHLSVSTEDTPFFQVWSRSGDALTKLPDPAVLPVGRANGIALSSDGTYVAVANQFTPFVEFYKRTATTLTKLTGPVDIPLAQAKDVVFSPDDTYVVLAHEQYPYITVYERSGDTFTKINPPNIKPKGTARSVAFSRDGTRLFVAHVNFPYLVSYRVQGGLFLKDPTPLILPTGNGNGIAHVTL